MNSYRIIISENKTITIAANEFDIKGNILTFYIESEPVAMFTIRNIVGFTKM